MVNVAIRFGGREIIRMPRWVSFSYYEKVKSVSNT